MAVILRSKIKRSPVRPSLSALLAMLVLFLNQRVQGPSSHSVILGDKKNPVKSLNRLWAGKCLRFYPAMSHAAVNTCHLTFFEAPVLKKNTFIASWRTKLKCTGLIFELHY